MQHIALLRGINVGGKRKILMADLRTLFKDLDYTQIQTYIQSGNVLFENHDDQIPSESAQRIKKGIRDKYGYDVPVMVIPVTDLRKAVEENPFYQTDPDDTVKYHLTFLGDEPDPGKLDAIKKIDFSPDQFIITDRNVFIRCEGKYHKSKLTNQFFEKKLDVQATTRNWKTVLKLAELSSGE